MVEDDKCTKSGVYWSWNGNAQQVGVYDPKTKSVVGAGGSGGEIFENEQSNAVQVLTPPFLSLSLSVPFSLAHAFLSLCLSLCLSVCVGSREGS